MHPIRARIVIAVLVLVILLLLVPIGMRIFAAPYTYASLDGVPDAEVAVVLGASVIAGKPSPVLAARADDAIALYKAHKVAKILVTGDNGALSHDEVTPVRKYLLDAGVAPADIFLDHAGFDTYDSMYRAKAVFGAHSAIIATQDFHLPRSLWIARQLGLNAYGYVAENRGVSVYDYVREIPASVKAVIDVVLRPQPKYLGTSYPLSGDGQATWY